MRLARLAMFIMGFIIVIAITKGALVLLIPILAIMIPIIAIVSFSPIGKAIAQSINGGVINNSGISVNDFNQLKEKYEKLEDEMNKMREAMIFQDTKKISAANSNSEENKIKANNQINLEKNL